MKALFKYLLVCAGVLVSALWLSTATAMPSYARQTGMDCNSCHIGFDAVPYFTRTGRLFIMKGFHQPNSVRGKLRETGFDAQGNDTPEYGGNYLALNWNDFWSVRFISTFLAGGYTAGQGKNNTTSTAVSRIAMYFTGPITDWLGLWTEIGYLGNNSFTAQSGPGQGYPTNLNTFADDEYRLTASKDIGDNSFIAAAIGSEYPDAISEFVFPIFLITPWSYGQGGVGKEYSTTAFSFYGFFDNHYFAQFSPITGDYDNSWSNGHNNYVSLAYNGIPGTGDTYNRESMDMWWELTGNWGNNVGSMVNPHKTSFICTTNPCPAGISDSNNALSFTNTQGSHIPTIADIAAFDPTTTGENPNSSNAWRFAWHNSVADMGNHSWFAGADIAAEHQSFPNGARATYEGIGGGIRYFYNRTYGFEVGVQHPIYYDYTSSTGTGSVAYSISAPNTWNLSLLWIPAMNINIALNYSPSSPAEIRGSDSPGRSYSYSFLIDYGF